MSDYATWYTFYKATLQCFKRFYETDGSKGMPILAHNEKIMFFKNRVIMLYGIYSIKNYHYSIMNSIITLRLKLLKLTHVSSI